MRYHDAGTNTTNTTLAVRQGCLYSAAPFGPFSCACYGCYSMFFRIPHLRFWEGDLRGELGATNTSRQTEGQGRHDLCL
jgi:hypothetical protein